LLFSVVVPHGFAIVPHLPRFSGQGITTFTQQAAKGYFCRRNAFRRLRRVALTAHVRPLRLWHYEAISGTLTTEKRSGTRIGNNSPVLAEATRHR
jgi:hypothetical protein